MSAIVTIYAVFGSDDEAQRICRLAVEEKLAACANILAPCRSIYRWQGHVEKAQEVLALLKTRSDVAPALLARIAALHSYGVPAAVIWPIDAALPAYADWVLQETQAGAD